MSSIINSSIDPTFLFPSHLLLFFCRQYLLADDQKHNDYIREPKTSFAWQNFDSSMFSKRVGAIMSSKAMSAASMPTKFSRECKLFWNFKALALCYFWLFLQTVGFYCQPPQANPIKPILLCFPIFVVKLGHFIFNYFFPVTNMQT